MLTIDEAIKHCNEQVELLQRKADYTVFYNTDDKDQCIECANDHRQLAEWLTELQQWRRVYGVCPSYEMCIPECKEGYDAQIAEYKRLLRLAVEDFDVAMSNGGDTCEVCKFGFGHCKDNPCKWRFADEAERLLGDRI